MRLAVLFIIALAGLGTLYFLGDQGTQAGPGQSGALPTIAPKDLPEGPVVVEPEAAPEDPTDRALSELAAVEVVGEEPGSGTREPDATFAGETLVEFHGSALIQSEGQRPYPAMRGTIEIRILNDGKFVPVTIQVNQGKFSAEVPMRCRAEIVGGVLEGQAVRFLGCRPLMTLDHTMDYAFIGEPIPTNRLRVFEGTQRVPLAGITVRRHEDASTALAGGQEPVGEIVIKGAASPVELPFIPVTHPIWLHVSAEGYATTAVLVDPREPNEKDVVLWPAAGVVIRVTGPGRTRLKALLLHRLEPTEEGQAPAKRHFSTLNLQTPGITTDQDATIFTLEGVPALPIVIEARGFDNKGRETRLGTSTTELGPLESRTVELYLKDS